MSKNLIVNADDFGQSAGINAGIIESFEKGIVTSTSLMVNCPGTSDAVAYAMKNPSLGVGLHIDLGEWILQNAEWISVYEIVPTDNLDKVKQEVINQLESFCRMMGRKPTHIDSHQHVHNRKNIRGFMIDLARSINVTLRGCSETVTYCGKFYGQLLDATVSHKAIGVYGLMEIVSRLNNGITELACHPGLDIGIETMYNIERSIEVKTLCRNEIRQLLNKLDIQLMSFDGIGF